MSEQEDYFGLSGGSDGRPRAELLEGISEDLHQGANDALDGLEFLRYAEFFKFSMAKGLFEAYQDKVTEVFREFSEADLKDTGGGLQSMINSYEPVWKNLSRGSITELRRAKELLGSWRGNAAEDVKTYLDRLSEAYEALAAEITVVESDIVAARDGVWAARDDLGSLALTFRETAEKYQKAKAKEGEISWSKVAAVAFTGALVGMLAVVATPAGAAAAAGGLSMSAVGAQAAVAGAGAGLTEVTAQASAKVEGDNADDIFESFLGGVDKIRSHMQESAGRLADKIHEKSVNLPPVPSPPDVSPGDSFDPSNFETSNTPKGTEKRVRDRNVDIAPDGSVSQPFSPSTMD
ncbi:hypothetical protein CU254_13570 [Amycolatopsis sp. AA4]|uniref:hypothetical protein n=1 Tax=Actinomycetes TaxID=1760 RepID=UPI0001B58025|nr:MULTISPECIES: hypothetical protein [Actinomycetes]ATY11373.1 hypothetical protein CU254_13570 [Amycolatopsis sp. AA4]EFL06987.1 hypothetical protein SSMG_02658 [Streptomyces sp. AA4]